MQITLQPALSGGLVLCAFSPVGYCAAMPPIEHFMDVSRDARRQHFFEVSSHLCGSNLAQLVLHLFHLFNCYLIYESCLMHALLVLAWKYLSKLGLNFEKIITFGRWRERYCRTLFFGCMLISQFSYVENSLHFIWQILKTNILLSKFLLYYCFHFTENIAYHNPEMSIVCVDKVLVMGR